VECPLLSGYVGGGVLSGAVRGRTQWVLVQEAPFLDVRGGSGSGSSVLVKEAR